MSFKLEDKDDEEERGESLHIQERLLYIRVWTLNITNEQTNLRLLGYYSTLKPLLFYSTSVYKRRNITFEHLAHTLIINEFYYQNKNNVINYIIMFLRLWLLVLEQETKHGGLVV